MSQLSKHTAVADSSAIGTLQAIFRRHCRPIAFTYSLFIVENLIRLMQPMAMGLAVSDLLQSSTRGMWLFIAQCVAQSIVATARNLSDTRTFGKITAELAGEMVLEQRSARVATSRVAARSSLSREFAAFFEREMPVIISTTFSLLGSLAMLVWFDPFWGVVGGALSFSYVIFARVLKRKSAALNSALHDLCEREVEVIERHDQSEVRRHFDKVRSLQVQLSDWCGFSLGLTDLSLVAFLLIALAERQALSALSAGELVALIRYAVMFVTSLTNVPLLVQAFARLRDIGTRLQGETAACKPAAA
jgi:hypothetical protein